MTIHFARFRLAFLFGSLVTAQEALSDLENLNAEKVMRNYFSLYILKFCSGVISYSLAYKSGGRSLSSHRRANRKLWDLSKFARERCTNLLRLLALLPVSVADVWRFHFGTSDKIRAAVYSNLG